jgi:hypothetical protein
VVAAAQQRATQVTAQQQADAAQSMAQYQQGLLARLPHVAGQQ